MNIYTKETCRPLLYRPFEEREEVTSVRAILNEIRTRGDEALFEYERKFDGASLDGATVRVSEAEFERAYAAVDPALLGSLKRAIDNVLSYHMRAGRKDCLHKSGGALTGYVVRPVGSAGIYVPAGTAPLSSSVLMAVLPARAAGVKRIAVATPAKGGAVHPLTLVAARECGAHEVYKMGGAQAIGAFAYGTKSVKKVDVIAGPGNIYVTLAKKEVYGQVGIDMLAGPSEIAIVADEYADADCVAADVLSQAEHDVLARAIVIVTSRKKAEEIAACVEQRLQALPRKEIALQSLENNGGIVVVRDTAEAVALCNELAPEHLELYTRDCGQLLDGITSAGAVFLGAYTPEPVGDYFAGPSHILPTGGSAKFFSVLNEDVFTRKMSVIRYSREAIERDARDIAALARSEGLEAHALAALSRTEEKK